MSEVTVETTAGKVRGMKKGSINIFNGRSLVCPKDPVGMPHLNVLALREPLPLLK